MYHFTSRIRYSEINKEKQLDLASLINYFQDSSTFQSEDAGVGIEYLESNHRLWLMNAWQIVIHRTPLLFEHIKVTTWPYDFSGIYGYRNFTITDEAGHLLAAANSIWINMDTILKRPVKIKEEDIRPYTLYDKLDMDYAPRKIQLPDPGTILPSDPFPVTISNIDTNHHVNNGQYIKMAENYLPENFSIGQMRAEYRKSAVLGNMIFPGISILPSHCTITLSDENGSPYAIIEFQERSTPCLS